MGMGMGTRCVLQPRHLGWMAWRVSTTESLVPSATSSVYRPAGIRRQLALSAAKLHAAPSAAASGDPAGSRQQADLQAAYESPSRDSAALQRE
jgi:hypothetical protein